MSLPNTVGVVCPRWLSDNFGVSSPRTNGAHAKHPQADLADGVYLADVSIAHVRCFGPEQRLSLVDENGKIARWTVILGENGVGKTTLLQMMALLASRDSREVEHLIEFEMFERRMERWEKPPREHHLAARVPRGKAAEAAASAVFRSAAGETATRLWFGAEPATSLERVPFLYGYGAGRRLGVGSLKGRRRSNYADAFLSLFIDTDLTDAEEWLLQADYASARGPEDVGARRRVEVVKELLLRVLPDVTDIRIVESSTSPEVELRTPYGWVPVAGLSLGFQTLIAWTVDLAARFLSRFDGVGDPLSQPAIVLVDEIDLHLHPRWQRQLIGHLTQLFRGTQFIATAHSPLVVQAAENANIVVLRRDGDHVVVEAQPSEVKNWRIDQILTSDLYGLPSARPPQLDSLLHERREILEKAEITAADERRLRSIEKAMGSLPGGETPEEIRAMVAIERASRALAPSKTRRRGAK